MRTGRRRWYAFHENPPMRQILKPKILWPDIAREPVFYIDTHGSIIPRHTVYYLTPRNPAILHELHAYLNSEPAREWIKRHAQRAANGYLRLQTHVIKNLPIPQDLYKQARAPRLDKWVEARGRHD